MTQIQHFAQGIELDQTLLDLMVFFKVESVGEVFWEAHQYWYVPNAVYVSIIEERCQKSLQHYHLTSVLPDFFQKIIPLSEKIENPEVSERPSVRGLIKIIYRVLRNYPELREFDHYRPDIWPDVYRTYYQRQPLDPTLALEDQAEQSRWDKLLDLGMPVMKRVVEKRSKLKLVVL